MKDNPVQHLTQTEPLESAAGSVPLGSFIRARLLDEKPRRTLRRPVGNAVELGRVLGAIGRSNIASALSDLASAAKLGTVTLTPELEAEIERACAYVRDIRLMLMQALGFSDRATP